MFSNGLICFSYVYRILVIKNKLLTKCTVSLVCSFLVCLSTLVGVSCL